MSKEIWLRTNVRALVFGMIPPAIVGMLGVMLIIGLPQREPAGWMRWLGGLTAALGAATVLMLLWQLRQPRLAYDDEHLLVALRSGPPIRVPIEVVECFWLGQAPSLLPGKGKRSETRALVIRIAERAVDWHHQPVKPQLGTWCEGYVTIRGTWCEPLSIELVNRLNQRLAEVTRATSG